MTSIFGGEQTIPQAQFTNQTGNQTTNQNAAQTAVQSYQANPLAQGAGGYASEWANVIGSPTSYGGQMYSFLPGHGGTGYGATFVPGLNVAGLTPEQNASIQALQSGGLNAGNSLVPFGAQAINQSGTPITSEDINSFYNPMAGNITANLQDIFNQQNLAARVGGTSATGGVGGDRAAVAQSLLAKQQGLSAGQTYAGLYQSALQAAQQQKAQQLQSGQAGLQGGFGALSQSLQAASIPQAQKQAENQALYQQELGAYQDPFMRSSALSGAISPLAGLGGTGASTGSNAQNAVSQTNQGSTGTATTTYPAPPFLGQVAGLGSLALGAGMLFGGSDKREKTDIQKYGKDKETGLPMYAFRYKGDPKHYPKVVGPMAQDIKKKYPDAVKQYAVGGRLQRFADGGYGDDYSMQSQGDAYSNYADAGDQNQNQGGDAQGDGGGGGGGGGLTPPYQQTGSTWDLKKIFSPDRLAKAQKAILLGQKMAQQSQVARPRVSPITFPQIPWKSGITFARGGRLAVHPRFMHLPGMRRMPSLPSIRGIRQEGGRVDAMTARDWGPGQTENYPRYRALWDQMLTTREPWRGAKIRTVPQPNAQEILGKPGAAPGVYRLGGKIRGYDDGGPVDDTMPWIDPMPESDPEPPGLPGLEGDTGDTLDPIPGISGVPLPGGRPPEAGPGAAPFRPGGGGGGAGLPGAAGQTLFGKPVSPGAMALVQAGLGMLAASGQRDSRGLPMSGLGAIGAGGLAGMKSYQSDMEQQRKEALARDSLAQRNTASQQSLEMRNRAQERLDAAAEETRRFNRAREANWAVDKRKPIKMTDADGNEYLADPGTGAKIEPPTAPQDPFVVPPPSAGPGVIERSAGAFSPGVPQEGEGTVQANAKLAGIPFNYSKADEAPYIEKGGELPEPEPVAGISTQALKMDAQMFLETGKLPPISRGKSPVAIQQNKYRKAVQNYGAALAQSRGLTPEDTATMWRSAPGRLRFVLGADGRSTVALGTAVRHLDTMKELTDSWAEGNKTGNWQTWNRLSSRVRREFGDASVSNIQSAAQIIGPEIIKALGVAGAGTHEDRNAAGQQFSVGSTPQQIYGAINTTQKLLGGQLEGRMRQANKAGVSERDFEDLIGKRAFEALKNADKPLTEKSSFTPGAFTPPKGQGWMWNQGLKQFRDKAGKLYDENGNPI